jgi:hypothetical protein
VSTIRTAVSKCHKTFYLTHSKPTGGQIFSDICLGMEKPMAWRQLPSATPLDPGAAHVGMMAFSRCAPQCPIRDDVIYWQECEHAGALMGVSIEGLCRISRNAIRQQTVAFSKCARSQQIVRMQLSLPHVRLKLHLRSACNCSNCC